MGKSYDAAVVGSGPNGLAAAITLAKAGLSVAVFEAKSTVGGGMRSEALTLPGFVHDVCSAVHPLGAGSPFFSTLPLHEHGLEWVYPDVSLAHPLDCGKAALLEASIEKTGMTLGSDAKAYAKLMQPLACSWKLLAEDILAPLHFPRHPFLLARFGFSACRSAIGLANTRFDGELAKALFAGLAAHSIMPLDKIPTAAFGLILAMLGHAIGWPFAKGGSQSIANALSSYFLSLGGEIILEAPILRIQDLPPARTIFFDVSPKQLLTIAGGQFPACFQKKLQRYRYGPGVFKMDWALSSPIPWRAKECQRAGTVHVGGSMEEIANSERLVWEGQAAEKCFVIAAQPSLFDPTRAPFGKHTAWAYCHVPNGSNRDMSAQIEAQIERFAPGFRDCILARRCVAADELERYNPNYVGGDIAGGVSDICQLFARPVHLINPYSTPAKGLYLCSASTPPGAGVHGMCGYFAAREALKKRFHVI